MLAVIAYHAGDRNQAARLADWILELGGCHGHSLLVMRDQTAEPIPAFAQSFDAVEEIVITDDVWKKWAESCNNAFKKAAKHIQYTRPEPWLWLEPDIVPMHSGWLDEIAAEYAACDKPFLGDYVSVHTPELDVPDHMSGCAVYPGVLTDYAGLAVVTVELAWDCAAADQIVPQMATSKHLIHSWKHGEFANWEQVEREIFAFKPECVLFHASKDGSLIDILRAERNKTLPVPVLAESVEGARNPASVDLQAVGPEADEARGSTGKEPLNSVNSRGGQFISGLESHSNAASGLGSGTGDSFTCDILIKSYPPDYELLGYCLRSIDKFASGFRQVVILIPSNSPDPVPLPPPRGRSLDPLPMRYTVVRVEETGEGYLFQQAVKINAHEYTDADYILHIDSDTMLTKPVMPLTFFREVFKSGLGDVTKSILGKPVTEKRPLWLMTPYAVFEKELHDNPGLLLGVMAWKPITEKFIGEPVEYEFMRRPPMLIPRSLHVSADVFCRVRHKMSLAQYILSQPHRAFSEFNALGALAYSRARDEFSWLDTTKEELPELVAIQRWSHEPLTDAIRAELEEILKGGDSLCAHLGPSSKNKKPQGSAAPKSDPESAAIRQTAAGHWIINGDTHISAWVEEKGQLQHDFQTLPLILAEINEGDVVVDVGANIGDTTWPFIEKVGDKGHVYAFEPNPDAFACLLRNVGGELSGNVTIENVALGDVPAGGYINAEANAGAASISDHGKGIYIVPLDSRDFDRCDFIKIDVEGYELNVLRGAEQTIAKFRPKMAIEINEGALRRQGTSQIEVFAWLDAHAYQWWPLVAPNLEQDLPQYDILCRPMEIYDTPVGKKVRYKNEPRAHSENLQTTLVPWESKPESIAEIRRLCARLKEFETCPAYTALVRKELKIAKVVR